MLKRLIHTDQEGRKRVVLLPEGIIESEYELERAIVVGPPSISELGLPTDIEVRLHNELFARDIITAQDALKKRQEIVAAIQSTLKVDANRIIDMYVGEDFKNARTEKRKEIEKPNIQQPVIRKRRR